MLGRPALAIGLSGLAVLLLAGCASERPASHAAAAANPSRASQTSSPQGYYKVGNPYQINGVWYYPAADMSYDESGIASWYGEDFHGKYTANGEVFDLNAMTAAHKTLALPTIVQVTNLDNGRSVRLRVNDRGPYFGGRVIDVSRRAAQLLGFEGNGTAKVRVQVIAADTMQAQSLARHNSTGTVEVADGGVTAAPLTPVAAETLPVPAGVRVAAAPPITRPVSPVPVAVASLAPPQPQAGVIQAADIVAIKPVQPEAPMQVAALTRPQAPPPRPMIAAAVAAPARLPERVSNVPVHATNIYVQAGAFTQPDNAQRLKVKLDRFGPVRVTDATVNGAAVYRVRIGPVASVDEADRLLGQVNGAGISQARIIVD